jgi:signal transduction histidine kinase
VGSLGWWKRTFMLLAIYSAFSLGSFFIAGFVLAKWAGQIRTSALKAFAGMITAPDRKSIEARVGYLRRGKQASDFISARLWVVEPSGKIIASTDFDPLPIPWEAVAKPTQALTSKLAKGTHYFGGQVDVFRLDFPEPLYMVAATLPDGSTLRRIGDVVVLFSLLSLIGNALLGSVTFVLITRWKARQASAVLSEFGRGNLKARFPMTRSDELGLLMQEFNRMASTIEEVFTKLKRVESTRRTLLQDINHDFRTPLATLEIILERLSEHQDRMAPGQRAQSVTSAVRELDYMKRLTEFLFLIAESDEPAYRVSFETQNLGELLEQEIAQRKRASGDSGKNIAWELMTEIREAALVEGDRSLLLRLVRNGLDNAKKFARSQVTLLLTEETANWRLVILDDGPGPSPKAIAEFGQRREASQISLSLNPEVSAGLGSVIMKAISSLHGGSARLEMRPDGKPGAALVLLFPRANAPVLSLTA